jgi:hypothetical protein
MIWNFFATRHGKGEVDGLGATTTYMCYWLFFMTKILIKTNKEQNCFLIKLD